MTDENYQVSHYYYNDPWFRLTEATYPDGGQKNLAYDDAGPNPSVTTSTLLNSSGAAVTSTTIMDAVGQVIYAESTSDPYGSDTVKSTYDGNGRLSAKSNPFRGCPAPTNPYPGCTPPSNTSTSYFYDALNRPTEASEQDGHTLQWCYNGVASTPVVYCSSRVGSVTTGTWVDSTDEKGSHWQRTSDALGRLTEVMEPSGTSQTASMETDYVYDALNDLLSVKQCGALCTSPAPNGPISRSFSYDSLSRLISAFNPETNTVGYSYDANGNLMSKTDARGVITSYSYDALNRLLSKSYSDRATPFSCYQYDLTSVTNGTGRLSNAWTLKGSGSGCSPSAAPAPPASPGFLTLKSIQSYDRIGRPTSAQQQQCIGSMCAAPAPYALSMAYDLAGNVIGLTNSVGAAGQSLTLNNYFDGAARPCLATATTSNSSWNSNFPATLLQTNPNTSDAGYAAFGGLQNWFMGSSSASASTSCGSTPSSAIDVTQSYTNRLWVNNISATGQIP